MNAVKWTLLIYLVFAANLVLGPRLAGSDVLPDPVLVLAVLVIVTLESSLAFAVAGLIGLCGDLLWGDRLGTSMFCLSLVGYSLGGIKHWFDIASLTRSVAVSWFLATAFLVSRAFLSHLLDGQSVDLELLLVRATWEGFWCGTAVYFVHLALVRSKERFSLIFHAAA